MPEVLKFEHCPSVCLEYHIEPFREEYIPGAVVLCHEGEKGNQVFFQIPKPIAQQINTNQIAGLKQQVHDWWQTEKETIEA